MKNTFKVFGVIVCLAITGFLMPACAEPGNELSTLTGTVAIDNTSPKVGDILTAIYSGGNGTGNESWAWLADGDVINGRY